MKRASLRWRKEGIAETARLDVRNTADVNAFAKRVGKIDILLNAAGFVHHGTILDCSEEDWDFSFDLNVKSMHRTIKAFLPAMIAGGGGSIVNISSCAALRPPANRYVYSASKAAVSLLTRAVALRLHHPGHPLQQHLPRHRGNALDAATAPPRPARTAVKNSSPARRWAGSAPRKKSRPWRCISPATKAPSPPASTSSSTAATCSDIHPTKGFPP